MPSSVEAETLLRVRHPQHIPSSILQSYQFLTPQISNVSPIHETVAVQVSPYAQLASVNGLHDQQSWSQGPKGYSFFETPRMLITAHFK
jgi:hypothetical protein